MFATERKSQVSQGENCSGRGKEEETNCKDGDHDGVRATIPPIRKLAVSASLGSPGSNKHKRPSASTPLVYSTGTISAKKISPKVTKAHQACLRDSSCRKCSVVA